MTRKLSIGVVKVRKTNTTWKKQRPAKASKESRRAVRFASSDEVAFRHVTREELSKVWYQPQDYDSFKSDCRLAAREYVGAGGDITRLDPVKVCLRGLEQHLTRTSIMTRRMRISSSINIVLQEQKSQRCMGQSDPEKLRSLSRLVSESGCNRAITVASFDEKLCRL